MAGNSEMKWLNGRRGGHGTEIFPSSVARDPGNRSCSGIDWQTGGTDSVEIGFNGG